jgi:hypothetical protein
MCSQYPFRNLEFIINLSEQQQNSLEAITMADLYESVFKDNEITARKCVEEFLYPNRDTLLGLIQVRKPVLTIDTTGIQSFSDYLKEFILYNHGKEYTAYAYNKQKLRHNSEKFLVKGNIFEDVPLNEYHNATHMLYLINFYFKKLIIGSPMTAKNNNLELVFQYKRSELIFGVLCKIREYIKVSLHRLPPAIIKPPIPKYEPSYTLKSTKKKSNPEHVICIGNTTLLV